MKKILPKEGTHKTTKHFAWLPVEMTIDNNRVRVWLETYYEYRTYRRTEYGDYWKLVERHQDESRFNN